MILGIISYILTTINIQALLHLFMDSGVLRVVIGVIVSSIIISLYRYGTAHLVQLIISLANTVLQIVLITGGFFDALTVISFISSAYFILIIILTIPKPNACLTCVHSYNILDSQDLSSLQCNCVFSKYRGKPLYKCKKCKYYSNIND